MPTIHLSLAAVTQPLLLQNQQTVVPIDYTVFVNAVRMSGKWKHHRESQARVHDPVVHGSHTETAAVGTASWTDFRGLWTPPGRQGISGAAMHSGNRCYSCRLHAASDHG